MDQLPRLGKRELIRLLLFTCNYVVSVWRGFLFLWVLGMGYVILLWHSLSLPLIILCALCQELVRLTCGTPPWNSVLTVTCPVVDRSHLKSCLVLSHLVSGRTDINGYIPDTYRIPNARKPDKPHTNAQVTFVHRTSLSGGVRSKF